MHNQHLIYHHRFDFLLKMPSCDWLCGNHLKGNEYENENKNILFLLQFCKNLKLSNTSMVHGLSSILSTLLAQIKLSP